MLPGCHGSVRVSANCSKNTWAIEISGLRIQTHLRARGVINSAIVLQHVLQSKTREPPKSELQSSHAWPLYKGCLLAHMLPPSTQFGTTQTATLTATRRCRSQPHHESIDEVVNAATSKSCFFSPCKKKKTHPGMHMQAHFCGSRRMNTSCVYMFLPFKMSHHPSSPETVLASKVLGPLKDGRATIN